VGNFQALRQYSTKEYKFDQGKSLALLDPSKWVHATAVNDVQFSQAEFESVKGGICAVLAADWLREKLHSEKALFSGAFEGYGVHSGRNRSTVIDNVRKQLAYKIDPSPKEALSQHGLLEANREIGDPRIRDRVTKPAAPGRFGMGGNTVSITIKFAETIANACTKEFLKKGCGVYIGFDVTGRRAGGHAVAAYRSNGNTLYFFDCNCGVYNVTDPDDFFSEYAKCYEAIGYSCHLRDNDITYVD
jgi:hypothetical protein